MSSDRLILAAGAAFIHAILSRFFISFISEITARPEAGTILTAAMLALVNFALFFFVFTVLKRLFNERYHLREADIPILALIGLNGLGIGLTLLPLLGFGPTMLSWLFGGLGAVVGLGWVALAVQLFRLPAGTMEFLRPYALLIAASGVCFVSVRLLSLGVILGAIADLLLGVILFKESGKPTGF
ncbi:MAG: hypothetical protein N3A55_02020 [Methylohalobius sp.]|nr:hypothetical protein [Methylohalobius sp.]